MLDEKRYMPFDVLCKNCKWAGEDDPMAGHFETPCNHEGNEECICYWSNCPIWANLKRQFDGLRKIFPDLG